MAGQEKKDIRDPVVGQTHDARGQALCLLQWHLEMFGGQGTILVFYYAVLKTPGHIMSVRTVVVHQWLSEQIELEFSSYFLNWK